MKKKRVELTEEEKVKILTLRGRGYSYFEISKIISRPRSMISSFISYNATSKLFPKRGRKPLSATALLQVRSRLDQNPFLTLRDQANNLNLSHETIRKYRHEQKYHYFKIKDMPPLDDKHKKARIEYCDYILQNQSMIPIIFTDESMIEQNLHKKGIWRRRGQYPNGTFAVTIGHPTCVMVWGGIGPNGYKTPLLRCPERLNSISYAKMLSDNNIFLQIGENVPNFVWQQDGASPYNPCFEIISQILGGRIIKWPARSPDLSPIEQLWAIIKANLREKEFRNKDELFAVIKMEWEKVPNSVVRNLYESAYYCCIICKNHGGDCFN